MTYTSQFPGQHIRKSPAPPYVLLAGLLYISNSWTMGYSEGTNYQDRSCTVAILSPEPPALNSPRFECGNPGNGELCDIDHPRSAIDIVCNIVPSLVLVSFFCCTRTPSLFCLCRATCDSIDENVGKNQADSSSEL